MAEGNKTENAKSGGIFDGLSISQIVAAALAAVTSLFLSSQIGIAGSLIGAAVSSIVATVSSQVYKQFLSASAEKIKDIRPDDKGGIDELERMSREAVERAQAADASFEVTRRIPVDATGDVALGSDSASKTAVLGIESSAGGRIVTPTPRIGNADEDLSPTVIKARAERERKRRIQATAVVVAAGTALVAVFASAAIINAVTAGEGVGTKTQPIIPAITAPSSDAASNKASETSHSDAGKQESSSSQSSEGSEGVSGSGQASEEGSTSSDPAVEGSSSGESSGSGSGSTTSGQQGGSSSGGTQTDGSTSQGSSTDGSASGSGDSASSGSGSSSESGVSSDAGSSGSQAGTAGSASSSEQ